MQGVTHCLPPRLSPGQYFVHEAGTDEGHNSASMRKVPSVSKLSHLSACRQAWVLKWVHGVGDVGDARVGVELMRGQLFSRVAIFFAVNLTDIYSIHLGDIYFLRFIHFIFTGVIWSKTTTVPSFI